MPERAPPPPDRPSTPENMDDEWRDLLRFDEVAPEDMPPPDDEPCPRCGDVGCPDCRERRALSELWGIPRVPDTDDTYADRLAFGIAMLAEGDDSLLDD